MMTQESCDAEVEAPPEGGWKDRATPRPAARRRGAGHHRRGGEESGQLWRIAASEGRSRPAAVRRRHQQTRARVKEGDFAGAAIHRTLSLVPPNGVRPSNPVWLTHQVIL